MTLKEAILYTLIERWDDDQYGQSIPKDGWESYPRYEKLARRMQYHGYSLARKSADPIEKSYKQSKSRIDVAERKIRSQSRAISAIKKYGTKKALKAALKEKEFAQKLAKKEARRHNKMWGGKDENESNSNYIRQYYDRMKNNNHANRWKEKAESLKNSQKYKDLKSKFDYQTS